MTNESEQDQPLPDLLGRRMAAKNPARTAALARFIHARLKERNITAAAACRLAHLKRDAIRDIERGSVPGTSKLSALGLVLGASVERMAALLDQPAPPLEKISLEHRKIAIDDAKTLPLDDGPRDLHLVRQGRSAVDGVPADIVVTSISRPAILAGRANAYALYVPDDLNAPIIMAGHIAYIDPDRPVQIGRMVRVTPTDAGPFLGVLVAQTPDFIDIKVAQEPAPRRFAPQQVTKMERVVAVVLVDT